MTRNSRALPWFVYAFISRTGTRRTFRIIVLFLLMQGINSAWGDDILTRARALVDQQKPTEALILLEPLASERGGEAEYQYVVGLALVDSGRAPEAENVYFATGSAALNLNIAMPGFTYVVNNQTVNFASASFSANNITTLTSGAVPAAYCVAACKTSVEGQFYGINATHLGLAYSINDAGNTKQSIMGAAAFKR